MKTAFKMKGMDFGNSPLKQDVKISTGFGKQADANLSKKVNQSNTKANTTTPKVNKKPTSTLGRITKTFKNTAKQYAKKGLSIASKFSKSANVAALVLGSTTTSTADQPTKGNGKREYKGGKIDFTKTK